VIPGDHKPKLELKLGRQELNYGEGSLLAIRDLNVRRTFDGVKSIVRPGDWRIDLQDLAIGWRADSHTTFEALASCYEAGAFLREGSPPGKNLSYFSLKMNYRF
jgi:hypothetical protein